MGALTRTQPLFGTPAPKTQILLFSRLVVSDSLRPRGLQHARLPCLAFNHWFLFHGMI